MSIKSTWSRLTTAMRKAFPNKGKDAVATAEKTEPGTAAARPIEVSVRTSLLHGKTVFARVETETGMELLALPLGKMRGIRVSTESDTARVKVRDHRGQESIFFETPDAAVATMLVAKISRVAMGGNSPAMSGLKFAGFLVALFIGVSWVGSTLMKPAAPAFAGQMPSFNLDPAKLAAMKSQPLPMLPTPADLERFRDSQMAVAKGDLAKFGLGASAGATRGTTLASGGGILDPRNPIIAQCPGTK